MDEKVNEVEELEHMFTNESAEPMAISYSVIQLITKNFCQEIGRGGFGTVYLGALQNDVMVAVKQLRHSEDLSDTQFLEEVKCLKRVNHKNIVRFLGYCAYTHEVLMKFNGQDVLVDERKRFLCFEYAPNGNLQDYLHQVSSAEKIHGYEWSMCYKIIKGISEGLHSLHQKRINHLDLKPANVLLGAGMEPKITDFGLSKCNDGTQSTIVTKNLKGTFGYMPPELITEGKISSKSDIFSLGIIMRRLLMGSDNENNTENWGESLNVDCQQMKTCIEIAQNCTTNDPCKRPTINEIICKLTETETTIQNVLPDSTIEPRNDPNSMLCQNVKRFMAHRTKTREYHRGAEKLPMELPKWKLAFHRPPKLPIITGEMIKDANGKPLEVILVPTTGEPSSRVPEVLHIELVPLLGNFPRDNWHADDFQRGVVNDLQGKPPLLAGKHNNIVLMWDGRATVEELMFTDDSLECGCMFRIGVRVKLGSYDGARILEAMTEAFMVRNRQSYEQQCKKHLWQLAFQSQPRLPIYIDCQITDVIGNPLEVIFVDTKTGSPSACVVTKLDIQVFLQDDDHMEGSGTAVLNPQDKDAPLLSGDVSLTMKVDGRVTMSDLQFTAGNSSYSVRIVVCVVSACSDGLWRIHEAMTKAFKVQGRLSEWNMKRFLPGLGDEVWRLKMIPWGGVFHKRLMQNNVRNVEDFLRMLTVKPDKLRGIMDGKMEDSTWEEITSYARTCIFPIDKVYAYSGVNATIYVNSIFDLVKVKFGGVECPRQQLDEAQKILVGQTIREAYDHRDNLQEVQQTWKLVFKSQPGLLMHTSCRITNSMGNPLEIILVDAKTGSPWALPMDLHIELVPLSGDFPPNDGKEDWSADEFRTAIVKCRRVEESLLKGFCVTMRGGHVTVNELLFTDDSTWVPGHKFRIGARVVPGGSYDGASRILEALTDAFEVEQQKHYPPVLRDPVWRLDLIDKEGEFHKTLTRNNVHTVQEFLRMLSVKPTWLRMIMNDKMEDSTWEEISSHARTSIVPIDKVYAYSGVNATIYVNSNFDLVRVEFGGVECSWQQLVDADKRQVLQTIQEAYEHRDNLQEVQHTWKLEFKSRPRLPIFTSTRITDSRGDPLEIILVDAKTRLPCALPIELHIELVALFRDLPTYRSRENWSVQEFRTAIVKCFPGKGPLLNYGFNDRLTMRDGRVTVNELQFTDDSSWVPGRKFRIGARVVPGGGYDGATRILEAFTDAFVVEQQKHYPPVLDDPVWRLDMIDKEGELHRTLRSIDVHTVREFLRMLNVKPKWLRTFMVDDLEDETWMMHTSPDDGDKMKNEMLLFATSHAETCDPGDNVYTYSGANGTIYVDSVFGRCFKVEIDGVECSRQQLQFDKAKTMLVRKLILEAYEHRHNLREVGAAMELRDDNTIYIDSLLCQVQNMTRCTSL